MCPASAASERTVCVPKHDCSSWYIPLSEQVTVSTDVPSGLTNGFKSFLSLVFCFMSLPTKTIESKLSRVFILKANFFQEETCVK